jgi:hypothetical protein
VEPTWVALDDRGFKTINMSRLAPMVVDSIKTLKTENDTLRQGIVILSLLAATLALIMFLGFGYTYITLNKLSSK